MVRPMRRCNVAMRDPADKFGHGGVWRFALTSRKRVSKNSKGTSGELEGKIGNSVIRK